MTNSAPLPPGTEVGRFRITSEISSGGMGRVYRAEVIEDVAGLVAGTVVALKILHPHLLRIPGFFKRFLREGEVGKRIRHPNVVATYDLDGIKIGDETVLYMAMEYVDGRTLWSLFQELGKIPEDHARHLARELAKGLAAIHDMGVVHRDVKPENILVAADRSVKLMDLGVVGLVDHDARLSITGAFVGSALYAAPEQFDGAHAAADGRADLYSLGVVMYELVSDIGPHDAPDFAGILSKVMKETPAPLAEVQPGISPFFSELVQTLLAKDRDQRIGTAAELVEILTDGEDSDWWKERRSGTAAKRERSTASIGIARATPMIGRVAELARLESLFTRAAAGERQVVLVEGEAGIGKSRLVDELVARIAAGGIDIHFLWGAFPPGGAATASSAFDAAFRRFFEGSSIADALRPRFSGAPAAAAALAAHLRAVRTPAGPDALPQEAMPGAFGRLLGALAMERPTILFIDDLQLAPRQGLALFAAIAAAAPAGRLMLVGAARAGIDPDWIAELVHLKSAHRLALPRLGLRDAALLLIAAVRSQDLADELGFGLVEAAGGNPYFLLEIVRSMRESGALERSARSASRRTQSARTIRLPPAVMEILNSRLAALPEEDRELLDMSARLGMEFDPRVAADALDRSRVAVLQRLTRIERTNRIVHAVGDRFVFDHRGLVETLLAGMPDALGREYDARLAAALERMDADGVPDAPPGRGARAAALTDLFLRAGNGHRALRYLGPALAHLDAAQEAEPAAELAARALAVPGLLTDADRVDLLLSQSERLERFGRHAAEFDLATEALDLAVRSDDLPRRARALAARGRACLSVARYDDAIAALEECLTLATSQGLDRTEADARAVLGQVRCETGRYDDALAEHKRDLALREKIGDTEGAAAANGMIGDVHCELGRYDRAHMRFRRERELGLAERDRFARARTKLRMGRMLFVLGRYDDARVDFSRARTLWQLLGSVRGHATASASLGDVALAMGDPVAAHRHFSVARTLGRDGGIRFVEGRALLGLAAAAAARADRRGAFEHAARSLALRREIGDRAGIVDCLVLLGRLRSSVGAIVAAKLALTEALTLARMIGRAGSEVLAAAHLALLPGGESTSAESILAAYATQTTIDDRIEVHTLLWRATGSDEHLREAQHLMTRVLTHVPPELRNATEARLTSDGTRPLGGKGPPVAALSES